MLGLSYRGVEDFLTTMGFPISYSSVYLAVQKAAERLKGLKREKVLQPQRTVAMGADITGVKVKGKWTSLGITVDDVSGMVLTVDLLTEQTGEAIAQWIGPIAEAVGAELVVTDDAENFRTAVTQLALPHLISKNCMAAIDMPNRHKRERNGVWPIGSDCCFWIAGICGVV